MTKCFEAVHRIKVNKTVTCISMFWHSCMFFLAFCCFWAQCFGLDLFYCYSKYHYSFHYSSFVLVHVGYILFYSYLTVLYFIDLMLTIIWFHFEPGDVPSPLSYPVVPFESSLVCSYRNSFHNKKSVVTCACVEPGAVMTPERLTYSTWQ